MPLIKPTFLKYETGNVSIEDIDLKVYNPKCYRLYVQQKNL